VLVTSSEAFCYKKNEKCYSSVETNNDKLVNENYTALPCANFDFPIQKEEKPARFSVINRTKNVTAVWKRITINWSMIIIGPCLEQTLTFQYRKKK